MQSNRVSSDPERIRPRERHFKNQNRSNTDGGGAPTSGDHSRRIQQRVRVETDRPHGRRKLHFRLQPEQGDVVVQFGPGSEIGVYDVLDDFVVCGRGPVGRRPNVRFSQAGPVRSFGNTNKKKTKR